MMKAAWIGAFAIAVLGSAATGWALPGASLRPPAITGSSDPLLLVRHHHHRGHWRYRGSHETDEAEPEVAVPGADQPVASASPPDFAAPPQTRHGRASRGSGSSAPAFRWVDPEKSPR